ncbi:MAG: hypothetical protein KGJ89_05330 [Patescibacteria group bacterium]|nr:hypothetical protein [Patescibacteria group bacterium]MDE2015856.1 hypothetical protein [Patescibacteria group bacterium]MDE2227345.1 hypothetical protein [Patescibacteria group bacterium]
MVKRKIEIDTFYPSGPHPGQQKVLEALDNGVRFVQLRAGRKWRKTSLIISWLFEKAFETGLVCPYIAPNRVQAKNIAWDDHINRLLNHFTAQGLPYKANESELSITFPNGGKVQLLGVENKNSLRGISNWGAVGGDEYDDWEEDIYSDIIRPNLITYHAPIILGGTPNGFRNLYHIENMKDEKGSHIFQSFHFTTMDNPDIPKEELASLISEYKSMGMGSYRQEILAEYEKPEGVVYDEWDMKQYIPFWYDENLPLHLSWDFGVNDPTVVLFIQPNGSELRIVDYIEASNANLEYFVEEIDKKGYKKPSFEAGDISGRARSLITGKSPISLLRELGHDVRSMPIPDIEQQIRNAHTYVPNLWVSSAKAERFRDCILNYHYPEKSTTLVNQDNEQPVHDEYSHALRAFEYYCWNLKHGRVGAVHERLADKHSPSPSAEFFRGQQVGLDIDKFKH